MIETIEHSLGLLAGFLRLTLEGISVFCIFLGLLQTLKLSIPRSRVARSIQFIEIRLCFGSWLALALEFQLGADILNTTVAPSFEALGKLGIIALIRTFLNYFLSKELETEMAMKEKHLSQE
jgi:uncharacterized membrane protein